MPSSHARARRGTLVADLIWWLTSVLVRVFYRVERMGGDVPDGPVLLVANHANGLLDPAIVVHTARRRPRFLGKSTLFTMPVVGWFVRQVGTIPVYRRSDTGDTSRNEEMFRAVRVALGRGDVVCLFPEGISHSSGRLEPLKTGAARIALDAMADGVPLCVVPVGLNFEDKDAFRSTVIVTYGAPVVPAPDAAEASQHASDAVHRLTKEIATRLRDVMIEADPATEVELVDRVERLHSAANRLSRAPADVFVRRRLIADGMRRLREGDPERFAALYEEFQRYERRRERFGLTDDTLGNKVPPGVAVRFAVRESLVAACLLPIVVAGTVAFFVPYQLVRLATTWLRASLDQQATNKLGFGMLFYLLWIGGLAWWSWREAGGAWALAVAAGLPLLGLATLFAQEREAAVVETVRGTFAAWRTRDATEERLSRQRARIAQLLDETYRWVQGDAGEGQARGESAGQGPSSVESG
jgi:1-acyl-sn-glycerol-3-phosphate acyltransferase